MTGWSWDHVEQTMTIPRLLALEEVWKTTPHPARALAHLAATKGYKVSKRRKNQIKTKNTGAALELAGALRGIG